jgi:AcrR family transcriptional regulator
MKSLPDRMDLEESLFNAVDRLLALRGYRGMTIEDVAREAGVANAVVYLHFRTKEDLVLSYIDRIVRRVIEGLERIGQSAASPADKIRQMLLLRVMTHFDSVQHFPESLSEVLRELRTALFERREQYLKEEAKVFVAALREGEEAGIFRSRDWQAAASALLTATNSLLPFNLNTREIGKRREVEERTAYVADLLLSGLLQPGRNAKRMPK